MARPKRINESTGKPFRSDRELVYDYQHCKKQEKKMAAAYELWEKYFKLRMKMKFELIALARRNGLKIQDLIDEYDAYAWTTFIKQIDGIELSRVEHLKDWSAWIRIWGYWRSMNRDMLKEWFDWVEHVTPIEGIVKDKSDSESSLTNIDVYAAQHDTRDIQSQFDVDITKKIFWESIDILKSELNDKQKKLLNYKVNGKKISTIVGDLNITTKIYKEQLVFIKNRFSNIIENVAKKNGTKLNYTELTKALEG